MDADGSLDRFEPARLLLWIDSLVEMMFARTGSGADISDFSRSGAAWFEPYENVPKYDPLFAEKIVAELKRGYPVAMMIQAAQLIRPIRTAQIEAIPAECEGEVSLRWHVPRLYAKDISGFTITERKGGTISRIFEVGSEVRELCVSGLLASNL